MKLARVLVGGVGARQAVKLARRLTLTDTKHRQTERDMRITPSVYKNIRMLQVICVRFN